MRSAKLLHYLQLHLIVFIWGFTAILGKLIVLDALPLVWARMGLAALIILWFMLLRRYSFKVDGKTLLLLIAAGITIALHWITFFKAIKVSNVSITLATMATGALFTAVLEPIWYGRKFIWYELLFGLLVALGLSLIYGVNTQYTEGILLGILSAFLGAVFTLINGKLVQHNKPTTITFYEFVVGALCISIFGGLTTGLVSPFSAMSGMDWVYLGVLVTICTAYAFIASVKVMRYIRPYTVMLTVNLEPVYGIILALLIFGESEKMQANFYLGAALIIGTVLLNGWLKYHADLKS